MLPHGSVIVIQLMDVIAEGVPVVLMPHWVLVHGSIGLGGGVEGRRDAVTGLTAVVTVPVINGTVWVLVCSHNTVGDEMKLVVRLGEIRNCCQHCCCLLNLTLITTRL